VNREAALAGLALLVVLLSVAVAAAVPGVLAETDEDIRPSYLSLGETNVQAGQVSGETAELVLESRLQHRGGDAENVSVEVQAIDSRSGLVETTERRSLGTIAGEREVSVRTNVTVEREGGYDIVTRVYENGSRIATGRTGVSGVGSLTPEYARSTVSFHRFSQGQADLPVITYGVANASEGQVRLRTNTYLTNTGDEPAGGLELVLRARQAESNIIADSTTVEIGQIEPGRTTTPEAELTVPDDYNYHLDAILRRDGVIIGTASSGALLDPTRPVPENETRERVGLQAEDFERETPDPDDGFDRPRTTVSSSGPGFGVVAALVALLIAALAAHRRNP